MHDRQIFTAIEKSFRYYPNTIDEKHQRWRWLGFGAVCKRGRERKKERKRHVWWLIKKMTDTGTICNCSKSTVQDVRYDGNYGCQAIIVCLDLREDA
ncbi:hypothetical protein RJT34_13342 [Clitoria ternatea]|uniref:Uncharacterized protein n=1 Tax=Clitoria ternatea TaxID=43366 RepID=A0AAN9JRC8_CLITE